VRNINKKALIEAALFVSNKPLNPSYLSKVFSIPQKEVEEILEEISLELKNEDRGIMLIKTLEGYELVVKPEYRNLVSKIAPFSELSEGVKRCLAIIVAKQPVKQSTIVKIQGNKAYDYLKILEKKGLIKSEKFGRTKIISLTKNFEEYFGKSIEEIKKELLRS
jgi:segregation and condensation protein B